MRNIRIIFAILFGLCSCTSRSGSPPAISKISSNVEIKHVVEGKVIGIIDGDTYDI
jgi:hypothetical protein